MKKIMITAAIICIVLLNLNMKATNDADKKAVNDAILDYVEALYQVEPDRIAKSVDVTLRKYGYWHPKDSDKYRDGSEMNYKQLYNLAARWNKSGQVDAKTAKKEITILDILDKTASAKLVASWGIDYFHMSKEDGKWKIINVIWQSHPPGD